VYAWVCGCVHKIEKFITLSARIKKCASKMRSKNKEKGLLLHCLQTRISGFIAPDYITKFEMKVKTCAKGPNFTFSLLTLDLLYIQLYFVM
jgi:hypothetical protein